MSRELEKRIQLDGRTYLLNMYLGTKATELSQLCVRLLGRSGIALLMAFAGPEKGKKDLKEIEGESAKDKAWRKVVAFIQDNENAISIIADAIHTFSTEMSPKEFSDFLKRMMSDGSVEIIENDSHRQINFDLDFQGMLFHMYKLVAHNIKFQFLNFLADVSDAKRKAPETKAQTLRAQ